MFTSPVIFDFREQFLINGNPISQEEMEEFIEDAKEKRKEREEMVELTENAVTMEQIQQEVKTEIANIVDKMKLVAEDVKGVTVDKQI